MTKLSSSSRAATATPSAPSGSSSPNRAKAIIQVVGIFLLFVALSVFFFSPAIFEGRELFQGDVAGTMGTGSDVQGTGEKHYWTNSLFGGMPMYQISPSYPSTDPLQALQECLTLRKPFNLLGKYAWLLFALMGGFYLFMRSLRVDRWLSALGAVFWAFSSYFVILIAAGHIWKLMALCFIPPTIAGMIWIYQRRYLRGGVVMALGVAWQILANHVQMTYYFLFVMLFLFIAFLWESIQKKQMRHFAKSLGVMILAGMVGVAVNASNLYHTYQYSKYTMRGGSELSQHKAEGQEGALSNDATNTPVNASGLDKAYITQWSYGVGEIGTLLVPNLKGGASGSMGQHTKALEKAHPQTRSHLHQFSAYWGDQPFTSGPVYVGAFVFLLFVIGLFIVRGPVKWALTAATLLSILLSFGRNFMPLTDFFIDYIPLYDKFRAVSSILVIAEFTIPALAILALVELLRFPRRWLLHPRVWIPTAVTVALLVGFAALPRLFFDFLSTEEQQLFSQYITIDPLYATLMSDLEAARISVFRADVWRSIWIILLSVIPFVWLCRAESSTRKKAVRSATLAIVALISLIDLWSVNKRYLHDDMFMPQEQVLQRAVPQTAANLQILQDETPGYRVLNLSVNSFNDATTSRWHRSVGGYHPAKLQRYQDLIDRCMIPAIASGNLDSTPVFNMLNTRYFIFPSNDGRGPLAVVNPEAYGPAWFVQEVKMVQGTDQEMEALAGSNLKHTAIMDKTFVSDKPLPVLSVADSASHIQLINHTPSLVEYESFSASDALAIFSEIYYPEGWHLSIDGQPASILRANYILRAAVVPAGKHKLVFTFDPRSLHTTEAIAWIALTLLFLSLLAALFFGLRRTLQRPANPIQNHSNK